MSTTQTTLAPAPRPGLAGRADLRLQHIRDAVIRLAGNSQDGIQSVGGFLARLAGRSAPVGVATHDPMLAERALALLAASGTPAELELLRGLPRRRCESVARRMGLPVRLYLPFGGGWWSYAIDSALERPYLPLWWLKDRFSAAA